MRFTRIPPAVEIKIGSYAGSRFTYGIEALIHIAFTKILKICTPVLIELFGKADTSDNGKVSLKESMAIGTEYGVQLPEEGERELATVFGQHGEVN